MLRRLVYILVAMVFVGLTQACTSEEQPMVEEDLMTEDGETSEGDVAGGEMPSVDESTDLEEFNREAQQWGENVDGVKTRIDTEEKKLALTFDACGGPYGNGYDQELISFLEEEQIPATLFINQRWIVEYHELFLELAENPLFQIENHGTEHVPLSVNGGTAWGIEATQSPEEVEEEVLGNHNRVLELTGREMSLFRSGTAFYDEVAVELVNALGYEVVNFNILGDAGATYTAKQVESALLGSENGSIALLHMNQPESGTAAGVKAAVPKLREQGYQFVRLDGEKLE
ncbi:polysaccharide deacetylase family protein [Alkalihalophilus lindianensis]|uniref:Polysaccharide deacetylase family protein n=1 Tax=Alkalihalophilus lindianensis TaxID=1630542 RepID=A0ABU3XD42_9BACI|nr:polysaccharide deacetylase family protein [Alkalihalophilus lindianensis]MDV2685812.1 polysaccharide deacetylase family protein [Alkalihalophilus lindianensis]